MAVVLVGVAGLVLVVALAVSGVRVGRAAGELQRATRESRTTRLEALVALDRARERLDAAAATTAGRRAALDAELEALRRARDDLGLLAEAVGEASRLVRLVLLR